MIFLAFAFISCPASLPLPLFSPSSSSSLCVLVYCIDACWCWQYFFNSFCRFSQRFISFWFYYLDFCHSFRSLYLPSFPLSLPFGISVYCTFFMSLKRLPHATVATDCRCDINENISCGAAAAAACARAKELFPICILHAPWQQARLQRMCPVRYSGQKRMALKIWRVLTLITERETQIRTTSAGCLRLSIKRSEVDI